MSFVRTLWRRGATSGALLVVVSAVALPLQVSSAGASPARSASRVPVLVPGSLIRPAAFVATGDTFLNGVYCTARSDCWAVGEREGPRHNSTLDQVLHWNGTRWSLATVPSPGGSGQGARNELFAVRCLSAADCWTVGYDRKAAAAAFETQALHWNGTHWSRIRTSNPGGTTAGHLNALNAVRCGTARKCVTVGDIETISTAGDQISNEALHWNGRRWYQTPTPNPGGTLPGVTNLMAGATCSATTNCWAVGSHGLSSGARENETLHWNGKRWSLILAPSPAGIATKTDASFLAGARCVTKTDCWAVGAQTADATNFRNEILHWNGTKWSVVTGPGT